MAYTLPGLARSARGVARRSRLLISAAVIALAGIAAPTAPARSQTSDELLALILGTAAVAMIVRSFENDARPRSRMRAGVLPDSCLETVRLHRRDIDLYHAACLGWYGISRLPQRCETRIRTNVGTRRYFLARCLYEANYRPQGGWVSAPVWDAPGFVSPPYAPPRGWVPRPRDDRGWHDGRRGRDRDERGGWGRDRGERDWRRGDGRRGDRGDRDWSRGDGRRGDRDWGRGDGRRGDRDWSGGDRRSDERGSRREWRRDAGSDSRDRGGHSPERTDVGP